jgi:hypothetical protein
MKVVLGKSVVGKAWKIEKAQAEELAPLSLPYISIIAASGG